MWSYRAIWRAHRFEWKLNQSEVRLSTVKERYENILERIALSAQSARRDPDEVRLVVVTKRQPLNAILEAINAGAQYLGENYADEAYEKIIVLKNQLKNNELEAIQWHIIGHVQSRKASLVAEHFDYLHSLDSVKLSKRLDRFCTNSNRILPVLLEMNVSGEETKSGWPAWDENQWEKLLPDIEIISNMSSLRIMGLMTMAPFFENPESARPFFRRLRQLQKYLYQHVADVDWCELSMGMSSDFEVAVQEGATWVRIGQAILGPRSR